MDLVRPERNDKCDVERYFYEEADDFIHSEGESPQDVVDALRRVIESLHGQYGTE